MQIRPFSFVLAPLDFPAHEGCACHFARLTGKEDVRWERNPIQFWAWVLLWLAVASGRSSIAGEPAVGSVNRDYLLRIWEPDEGLPSISATAVAQTADGYLWVGTFNGLSRFDGVQFHTFRPENTPALPSAAAVRLYVDRKARLWVGTDRGLAVLDKGVWQAFGAPERWPGLLPKSFAEDHDGGLYVSARDQVLRLDGDRFVPVALPERGGDDSTLTLTADQNGTIWAIGDKYLGRMRHEEWRPVQQIDPGSAERFEGIARAQSDGVWVADSRRVRKFTGEKWTKEFVRPLPFQRDAPTILLEDSRSNVWAGCFTKGLVVFSGDDILACVREDGLSATGITSIYEDREGNIWAGTGAGGLVRLKQRSFTSFDDPKLLRSPLVNSVAPDVEGRLVLGGSGLLWFEGGHFVQHAAIQSARLDLRHSVLCVLRDRAGATWAGVRDLGLFRISSSVVRPADSELVRDQSIFALFEDSKARLWIGSASGVVCRVDDRFRDYTSEGGLPVARYHAIAEAADGSIWVGSPTSGLFRSDGGPFAEVLEAGQSVTNILSLCGSRNGGTWVGTENGRLLRADGAGCHEYAPAREIPLGRISCILEDEPGNLWIGSDQAIAQLAVRGDGRPVRFRLFGKTDGLKGGIYVERTQPAACIAPDGRLWFATTKGLAVADPRTVRRTATAPAVYVESMLVDGKAQRLLSASAQSVTVPAGAGRIEIAYTGISLAAPESLRFQYRVDGLDGEWRDVGGQRQVVLQKLGPGDYLFRVRAVNSDGIWSSGDTSLAFTVLPIFWESWSFRIIVLVCSLGAVFSQLWRVHQRRLREQDERALRDAHRLSEGTIDALPANICVLNETGEIIAINKAWSRFAKGNGAGHPLAWRGTNYLSVCDAARGAEAAKAAAFAAGIREVIRGARRDFELEYSCHSPELKRWFIGHVTRFEALGRIRIVIAHEDVTKQKNSELILEQDRHQLEVSVRKRTTELQSANELLAGSRERLIAMSLRLVEIQEAERRAIARELHDEVGQILTSLRILLDMTDRQPVDTVRTTLAEAKSMAGELIERIRQMSLDLRPPMLDDLGLLPTFEWHFRRYTKLTGIQVHFQQTGLPCRLPTAIETAAYRLVQEALTNVARYAKVTEVSVDLQCQSDRLDLEIEDCGIGFDPALVLAERNSTGLSAMRERVDLLHGRFEVFSRRGEGTRLQIYLPLGEF